MRIPIPGCFCDFSVGKGVSVGEQAGGFFKHFDILGQIHKVHMGCDGIDVGTVHDAVGPTEGIVVFHILACVVVSTAVRIFDDLHDPVAEIGIQGGPDQGGGIRDVEAELLASRIARCFDVEQVLYEPYEYNDVSVSASRLITSMEKSLFFGLLAFVAIPLPGTGAWTGSLVASLFGLPKRSSFLAVTLGVLISGVIMCLASYGVLGFLNFLL
jgi:hypothetical protein